MHRFTLLPTTVLLVLVASLVSNLMAQTELGWQTLPDAPATSRHNDVYFVTPDLGWIVNGAGEIFKTADGGASWRQQFSKNETHFRSVGFISENDGFVGNVGLGEFGTTDPIVLRETRDGGETWTPVTSFTGPNPVGICGMHVVNDSMVVAVGRVRGPATFVKTTDGGATWTSKNMSAYAAGLIDVYFFDPMNGLAVGLSNANHAESSGVILATSDGGETWEKRFTTTRTGEWFWKMSFPSRDVGYASLQRNNLSPIYFVKTTDGGETWQEKIFSGTYYFVQGIGFIDENVGWIGGNSSFPSYETTDGGTTWNSAEFGSRMNRLRFFGDTLGYAVGRRVYKYRRPTQIEEDPGSENSSLTLLKNHPNPFSDETTIRYRLSGDAAVKVTILDAAGRSIREFNATKSVGTHSLVWDGRDGAGRRVADGPYFYRVEAAGETKTGKMVRLN